VLTKILLFLAIREEMGAVSPLIRVQMVVMPESEDSYPDFVELFKDIVDIVAFLDLIDKETYIPVPYDTEFSCSQLWQRVIIAVDGSIGSCCADGETQTGLGNIKDTTLQAVWNGPVHKEMLRKHREFQWHQMEICVNCPFVGYNKSGSV
jgi:radical SAM protein with 4Fe4S-binding SPASM domain